MRTEHLAQKLMPAVRAMHPPAAMRRARRVEAAIDDEGRLSDYGARTALAMSALTWFTGGARSVANNISTEFRVPTDGRIERFDIRLKTGPSGSAFKCRLNRNGVAIATATIADGAIAGGVVLSEACNAGDILTIDVTQVGSGTAGSNLTASASYREERRS